MIHICSICNRIKECDDSIEPCTFPKRMAMNCGVELGTPFHQEEYTKAVNNGE